MKAQYAITTTAAVALAAATAKSIVGVRAGAAFGLDLRKFYVAFDGVTASAVPVLVELCEWSTTSTGTATAATPVQTSGRVIAHGTANGSSNFTVEPTTLTVLKTYLLTPNGGLLIEELSPDYGFDTPVSEGFVIRCTAPAIVNVRGGLEWQRI